MAMTEVQRVLIDIDTHEGGTIDDISQRTELGLSVVFLIVRDLELKEVIHDVSDVDADAYAYAVTRVGDEIMSARIA